MERSRDHCYGGNETVRCLYEAASHCQQYDNIEHCTSVLLWTVDVSAATQRTSVGLYVKCPILTKLGVSRQSFIKSPPASNFTAIRPLVAAIQKKVCVCVWSGSVRCCQILTKFGTCRQAVAMVAGVKFRGNTFSSFALRDADGRSAVC